MSSKKCIRPTIPTVDRRPDNIARLLEHMDREPPFDPAERMRIHKASKAQPAGGFTTVRVSMRGKLGNEAPVVRKMYDRTAKARRK